ncbi:hypothetical protein AVEN_176329-1 [Araneus ventricosus]|uniref:Uncharacterized protein n=1 Tax=Araneus ventricosus TaxID=182803 RepID=A0A4Y2RSU5_ARAVE|nr:hypothetical protein AVEN_176329-1 [Araneus ventricosus]
MESSKRKFKSKANNIKVFNVSKQNRKLVHTAHTILSWGRGNLVVRSWIRGQRDSGSKPDSTEDTPCKRARCTPRGLFWYPPVGLGDIPTFPVVNVRKSDVSQQPE